MPATSKDSSCLESRTDYIHVISSTFDVQNVEVMTYSTVHASENKTCTAITLYSTLLFGLIDLPLSEIYCTAFPVSHLCIILASGSSSFLRVSHSHL